jgi:phosphatidylglycerophosphatase A
VKKWIVTIGGCGLVPFAPGTFGTAGAMLILAAIYAISRPDAATWNLLLIASTAVFSILCVTLGPWGIRHFGAEDPGSFVLDEGAGISLTLLALPAPTLAWTWLAAFIAFRLFDATKPPPIRQLEHLPAGWGILADDLGAAVLANLLCQLVLRWPVVAHAMHL